MQLWGGEAFDARSVGEETQREGDAQVAGTARGLEGAIYERRGRSEAAAFGLPVLTTDGNGFAEALAQFPGAGEVIPNPRNPEAWTKALDSWLGKDISQEALEKLIASHTMDLNISKTVDLLSSLAQNHPQQ